MALGDDSDTSSDEEDLTLPPCRGSIPAPAASGGDGGPTVIVPAEAEADDFRSAGEPEVQKFTGHSSITVIEDATGVTAADVHALSSASGSVDIDIPAVEHNNVEASLVAESVRNVLGDAFQSAHTASGNVAADGLPSNLEGSGGTTGDATDPTTAKAVDAVEAAGCSGNTREVSTAEVAESAGPVQVQEEAHSAEVPATAGMFTPKSSAGGDAVEVTFLASMDGSPGVSSNSSAGQLLDEVVAERPDALEAGNDVAGVAEAKHQTLHRNFNCR